ncbi:MAG: uracil-DNA glycosylase [Gammaproteobacteria bacterium]|nr:uracil-DNA glycosylase [Gammaproteobacteria bacterium]
MQSDDRRLRFLRAIGVQAWVLREPAESETIADRGAVVPPPYAEDAASQGPEVEAARNSEGDVAAVPVETLDWDALAKTVATCQQCALHKGRTQTVFGTGSKTAKWLIVGEAPGADEDAAGEPFVGKAGKLLNAMICAVGAEREQVYIANIVKCRPPSNRNPRVDEAASCAPFLHRQIALLKPELILAVGRVAANNLLGNEKTLASLRGQVYEFSATRIPLVVTYHPAYLLRKPSDKAKAWQDLKLAMSVASPLAS